MEIRKITAGAASVMVLISGTAAASQKHTDMTAFAAADGGFSAAELQEYDTAPVLSLPEIVITPEEAKKSPNVRISLSVSGAAKKYATVELWTAFDKRLTIASDDTGAPSANVGEALSNFYTETRFSRYLDNSAMTDLNGIRIIGSALDNYGSDGDIFSVNVRLPDDVKNGDYFPLSVEYLDHSSTDNRFVNSLFTNQQNDTDGKKMQAKLFTDGIRNGFIRISDDKRTHPIGDTNLDGKVTLSDSMMVLQYIANETKYPLSGEALENADAYGPGDGITGLDAVAIQKYDTGLLNSLPESAVK